MYDIIMSGILVCFPILIYFVMSMMNIFLNKKYDRNIFIITIISSMYLIINYNSGNDKLYLIYIFSNIPIIVSYLKKELLLGIMLSLILIIFLLSNNIVNVTIIKLILYLVIYFLLRNKNSFNYLYVRMCALMQGLFISIENNLEINNILYSFVIIIISFGIVFLIISLFKIIDSVTGMYDMINKMKKEMDLKNSLFKLTHEIKNPIAVCKGYLDMINLNDYDKSCKYVDIIKNEINRSLNIMNDFMECSKVKINKEEIDISLLLDNVYESFKILCKNRGININYDNSIDEIYVMGDYYRLEQVLVNIIKNSIEAINENGIIDINAFLSDNDVIISVKDNGIGMDSDELANIKEMFYTTKRDGTGLGVALSNEIILLHDGVLEYDSVKNKGTTCTIKIPIEQVVNI